MSAVRLLLGGDDRAEGFGHALFGMDTDESDVDDFDPELQLIEPLRDASFQAGGGLVTVVAHDLVDVGGASSRTISFKRSDAGSIDHCGSSWYRSIMLW